jgi:beta-N-acetylhexosaminidase
MYTKDIEGPVGRLFMVGIPHPSLDEQTRALLRELRPSGVILFRRNYTDYATLSALCAELHALEAEFPPLIAVDHEGGRVHRLTSPFTHFPPAAAIGRARSAALARRVGLAIGRELHSAGIDLDFAPVLDVLTNSKNTVIGDRAFATDPHLVAVLGCAMSHGLREGGLIACGKHFPGHGATWMDSHEDLPRDERTKEEIVRTDLYPFRQAIAARVDMLMLAHIVYPAFDSDLPATLSPAIIEKLLRQRLHFHRVVVTDDLDMGAIVRHLSIEHAALAALQAGADLLLICHSLERAITARDVCVQALQDGTLSRSRVEQAGRRLAALRDAHQRRRPALAHPIGALEHQQLVKEILRPSKHLPS